MVWSRDCLARGFPNLAIRWEFMNDPVSTRMRVVSMYSFQWGLCQTGPKGANEIKVKKKIKNVFRTKAVSALVEM